MTEAKGETSEREVSEHLHTINSFNKVTQTQHSQDYELNKEI